MTSTAPTTVFSLTAKNWRLLRNRVVMLKSVIDGTLDGGALATTQAIIDNALSHETRSMPTLMAGEMTAVLELLSTTEWKRYLRRLKQSRPDVAQTIAEKLNSPFIDVDVVESDAFTLHLIAAMCGIDGYAPTKRTRQSKVAE